MASYLLIALHGALMFGVIVRVLLRRPARGVALAWLLLAMALPYVGAAAYLLVGERRISRSRAARIARSRAGFREIAGTEVTGLALSGDGHEGAVHHAPEHRALHQAATRFFGVPAAAGNRVTLHGDTQAVLAAMAADIDGAETSVLAEFYIWNEGGLTRGVLEALMRAAGRGVCCLVLVDAMGAGRWWKSDEPEELRRAGVELRPALPVGLFRTIAGRTDLRLHRKILAIDGAVAWTGSMNMVDPRFFKQEAGVGQWVDAMARIEGPAAAVLAAVMLGDWIAEKGDALPELLGRTRLSLGAPKGSVPVQVLPSGPGETGEGLLQLMLALINAARQELVLTTPYFVPEDSLVTALRGAAARGVKVTLILPEKIDSLLVRHASHSYFDEILEMGAEILCYRGGLLHTKSITVDGRASLFGTANLDMRSLWLNYEVSLLVSDADFTAAVKALQAGYAQHAVPVPRVEWSKRPLGQRLLLSTMRLVSPLL